MHSGDPAATPLPGKLECILSNPEGIGPGDDLQTLYHPWHILQQNTQNIKHFAPATVLQLQLKEQKLNLKQQ